MSLGYSKTCGLLKNYKDHRYWQLGLEEYNFILWRKFMYSLVNVNNGVIISLSFLLPPCFIISIFQHLMNFHFEPFFYTLNVYFFFVFI